MSASEPRSDPAGPPGGAPSPAAWLADPYTGPLRLLEPAPLRPHDPAVRVWSGRLRVAGAGDVDRDVGGAGWTDAAARGACMGEALERLGVGSRARDGAIHGARDALPGEAYPEGGWVGFLPEQYGAPGFPYRRFTADLELAWVRFRRSDSGAPVWVPRDLAELDPGPGHRHLLGPGTSTGSAVGPRAGGAVLRGLQEVIERDAVVGAWWGALALEELDPAGVREVLGKDVMTRLTRPNLTWRFLRVATPFSRHVCVALLAGEDREGFCFSVGTACRETRAAGLEKAALEAVQGRHWIRALRAGRGPDPLARPLRDFADHALYYSLAPGELAATPFAPGTLPLVPAADPAREDLGELRAALGPDRPVLVRDATPPRVVRRSPSLRVVRVVVPGMQPLTPDERLPLLGGPYWGRAASDHAALPPHPFP